MTVPEHLVSLRAQSHSLLASLGRLVQHLLYARQSGVIYKVLCQTLAVTEQGRRPPRCHPKYNRLFQHAWPRGESLHPCRSKTSSVATHPLDLPVSANIRKLLAVGRIASGNRGTSQMRFRYNPCHNAQDKRSVTLFELNKAAQAFRAATSGRTGLAG